MTPGQGELAAEDLRRADRVRAEATLLLDAGAREGGASRLYYAAFHAARAALAVRGRYAKTHSGMIKLFNQEFGNTPLLGRLFDLRATADYTREPFTVPLAEIEGYVGEVDALISQCRSIVDDAMAAGADEEDPPRDD